MYNQAFWACPKRRDFSFTNYVDFSFR